MAFQIPATNKEALLGAKDKAVYHKSEATLNKIKSLDWKDTAWKTKQLNFDDESVIEILDYIATNFDVSLAYDKESFENCLLNATFVDNTPAAILKKLELAFPLIKIKEVPSNKYEISGQCD